MIALPPTTEKAEVPTTLVADTIALTVEPHGRRKGVLVNVAKETVHLFEDIIVLVAPLHSVKAVE